MSRISSAECVDEHADLVRPIANRVDNLSRLGNAHAPIAAAVEIEPDRVGPGVDRRQRIVDVRDAADFDFESRLNTATNSMNSCYHATAIRRRCRFNTTGTAVSGTETLRDAIARTRASLASPFSQPLAATPRTAL